jgi:hypothetical protein
LDSAGKLNHAGIADKRVISAAFPAKKLSELKPAAKRDVRRCGAWFAQDHHGARFSAEVVQIFFSA